MPLKPAHILRVPPSSAPRSTPGNAGTIDVGEHPSLRRCWFQDLAGEEIWDRGGIDAWNPPSWQRWNGSAPVAFIPSGPGGSVENPRCRIIQCGDEIRVAEVLPEDGNVFIGSVGHRIGEKARREFQRFFWSSKPEDAAWQQPEVRQNRSSLVTLRSQVALPNKHGQLIQFYACRRGSQRVLCRCRHADNCVSDRPFIPNGVCGVRNPSSLGFPEREIPRFARNDGMSVARRSSQTVLSAGRWC